MGSEGYVAKTGQYILGVGMFLFVLNFCWGCGGKNGGLAGLDLSQLGLDLGNGGTAVAPTPEPTVNVKQFRNYLKLEYGSDDGAPGINLTPGVIAPPIIVLPSPTPYAAPTHIPSEITPVNTPKPTMPPLKPRPTKTPEPTHPPSTTRLSVRVDGIPEMTDDNKDELNKQVFFCLKGGGDELGIYHRYLQPDWPQGDWWPVWRMEYFRGGEQIAEVPLNSMQSLPNGSSATFTIDWSDDNSILVTCSNGTTERLSVSHPDVFTMSENCIGFASDSTATEL